MLSYARGLDAPVLEKNVYEAVSDAASLYPNHEALVIPFQNIRLTYTQLVQEVERVACGLTALGLRPGDRAGIWASNCLEWVVTMLACSRTGVVWVNVNPAYRSVDLAYVLRKSRMRALFLNEKDARADYRIVLEEARRGQTLPLEHVVLFGKESWRQFLASGSSLPEVQPRPDDVANIQYTSGTTGSPKGVLLTHRNIVNNAWLCGEGLQLTSHDRYCAPFPLYHCAGSVCAALTSFERGATYILRAPNSMVAPPYRLPRLSARHF